LFITSLEEIRSRSHVSTENWNYKGTANKKSSEWQYKLLSSMPEKWNTSTIINKPAPISDHANLYVTEVQITAMVATTSLPNPLQFDEFLSVAWYSHRQFGFDDWAFPFFHYHYYWRWRWDFSVLFLPWMIWTPIDVRISMNQSSSGKRQMQRSILTERKVSCVKLH